jgi:uncharacterized membrane protein
MKSTASVAKHPIHPMLVPLPIGLWIFSFIGDVVFLATGDLTWSTIARYCGGDLQMKLANGE